MIHHYRVRMAVRDVLHLLTWAPVPLHFTIATPGNLCTCIEAIPSVDGFDVRLM